MSHQDIEQAVPSDVAATLRTAGAAGAGGAGFPSYVKWQDLDDIQYLLVNHQESEPNFYADKWLLREHAEEFAAFFDAVLDAAFEAVVVGAKLKDREDWMTEFEDATDATVYLPDDLPIDVDEESGVVITYTHDTFQYGMENVLLPTTTGVAVGNDLPGDYGWIVQNTETLFNVYRAFESGEPVTRKYVHVDGNVPRHRFFEVPIGTPAAALFEEAGVGTEVEDDQTLIQGGPGWGTEIEEDLGQTYVDKSTNGILVFDADAVEEHTKGEDRVDILDAYEWTERPHETEPRTFLPETVRLPLITNPAYEGFVEPSVPTVNPGERVSEGDLVAEPGNGGPSIARHASVDGTVTAVTDTYVEIER